jgi:YHS domain-containing protein
MKKLLLAAAACAVLGSAALAGPGKGKPTAKTPTEIKCAVMTSHTVNIKEATEKGLFADYKGRRYFFCCSMCPPAFKKDPAKYAKNASIPMPKTGKTKSGKG